MQSKISSLRSVTSVGPLERAASVLQELGKELNKLNGRRRDFAPAAAGSRPIPVEVRTPPPTALENIASLISPLLRPLATASVGPDLARVRPFQPDQPSRSWSSSPARTPPTAPSLSSTSLISPLPPAPSRLGLDTVLRIVVVLGISVSARRARYRLIMLAGVMRPAADIRRSMMRRRPPYAGDCRRSRLVASGTDHRPSSSSSDVRTLGRSSCRAGPVRPSSASCPLCGISALSSPRSSPSRSRLLSIPVVDAGMESLSLSTLRVTDRPRH